VCRPVDRELGPDLDDTVTMDLAQERAGIGQINSMPVHSWCSPAGLLAGVDMLRPAAPPGRFATLPGDGGNSVPVWFLDPVTDATAALLARFPVFPGTHTPCAQFHRCVEGPAIAGAALAVGIPEDRETSAVLFMEQIITTRLAPGAGLPPGPLDTADLADAAFQAARSILAIGQHAGRRYREIYAGATGVPVPPGWKGTGMVAIPYLLPAAGAVPAAPGAMLEMTLPQWLAQLRSYLQVRHSPGDPRPPGLPCGPGRPPGRGRPNPHGQPRRRLHRADAARRRRRPRPRPVPAGPPGRCKHAGRRLMPALLVVMSGVLAAAGNVPVIRGTWRWAAGLRPVAMSWGGWAAIMLIGAVGSAEARQVPSMVLTGVCAGGCAVVAVLALRIPVALRDKPAAVALPGGRRPRLDLLCLPAAAAGLALPAAARDPGMAVAVSIATDAVLYVPTAAHAWQYPDHEPWQAYGLFGLAAGLALIAAAIGGHATSMAAAGYPWYLAVADTGVAVMILARRRVAAISANGHPWRPALLPEPAGRPGRSIPEKP